MASARVRTILRFSPWLLPRALAVLVVLAISLTPSERAAAGEQIQLGRDVFDIPDKMRETSAILDRHATGTKTAVLLVIEPHWLVGEQKRTMGAIQALLDANPELQDDVIFLGESIAAERTLSLARLTAAEPMPDDKDFDFLLGSYLIPGYVAADWAMGGDIPIAGMEDSTLLKASQQNFVEGQSETANWTSFFCRNETMAQNIIRAAREHKYVIAFAGGGHILGQDVMRIPTMNIRLSAIAEYEADRSTKVEGASLPENRNRCRPGTIEDFLAKAGIGYTVYSTFASAAADYARDEKGEAQYRALMRAELGGTLESYVASYAVPSTGNVEVTPEPDTAAKLLKHEPEGSDDERAERNQSKAQKLLEDSQEAFDNAKEHLTDEDLDAARREFRGEVVKLKSNDKPFDHVEEVRQTQEKILTFMRRLGNAVARQEPGSPLLQKLLGMYKRLGAMLDHTEKFVPRTSHLKFH